jgi:hypothetical protein
MRRLFKPMASPLGPIVLASCIAAALSLPAKGTAPVHPTGICLFPGAFGDRA